MKVAALSAVCLIAAVAPVRAQVPVTAAADQARLLASPDPRLAANKRLVYDFWRSVLDAGHLDLAPKYMAEDYIQHNPNVPTGRKGFVEYFGKVVKPGPIKPTIEDPLVAITAEGDRVVLAFVDERRDPADSTKTYTTTAFDMFRVAHGKVAEHWDGARKR